MVLNFWHCSCDWSGERARGGVRGRAVIQNPETMAETFHWELSLDWFCFLPFPPHGDKRRLESAICLSCLCISKETIFTQHAPYYRIEQKSNRGLFLPASETHKGQYVFSLKILIQKDLANAV
jgi:hypothetical protein